MWVQQLIIASNLYLLAIHVNVGSRAAENGHLRMVAALLNAASNYRGTSLMIDNSPPPKDHHRTLGIGLR